MGSPASPRGAFHRRRQPTSGPASGGACPAPRARGWGELPTSTLSAPWMSLELHAPDGARHEAGLEDRRAGPGCSGRSGCSRERKHSLRVPFSRVSLSAAETGGHMLYRQFQMHRLHESRQLGAIIVSGFFEAPARGGAEQSVAPCSTLSSLPARRPLDVIPPAVSGLRMATPGRADLRVNKPGPASSPSSPGRFGAGISVRPNGRHEV